MLFRQIGVAMEPGSTQDTSIPQGESSWPKASLSASSANHIHRLHMKRHDLSPSETRRRFRFFPALAASTSSRSRPGSSKSKFGVRRRPSATSHRRESQLYSAMMAAFFSSHSCFSISPFAKRSFKICRAEASQLSRQRVDQQQSRRSKKFSQATEQDHRDRQPSLDGSWRGGSPTGSRRATAWPCCGKPVRARRPQKLVGGLWDVPVNRRGRITTAGRPPCRPRGPGGPASGGDGRKNQTSRSHEYTGQKLVWGRRLRTRSLSDPV